jgi:hypothetical protein
MNKEFEKELPPCECKPDLFPVWLVIIMLIVNSFTGCLPSIRESYLRYDIEDAQYNINVLKDSMQKSQGKVNNLQRDEIYNERDITQLTKDVQTLKSNLDYSIINHTHSARIIK